jgi:hypothetical protein
VVICLACIWDTKCESSIETVADVADSLKDILNEMEVGNYRVWHFDKIVADCVHKSKCPCSADCFYVVGNEVLFVEFKGKGYNGHDGSEVDKMKIEKKASETIHLFRQFIIQQDKLKGKKTKFILVDGERDKNENKKNISNIVASYAGMMLPLDYLERFQASDHDGNKLFYDAVERRSCYNFITLIRKNPPSLP